MYIWVLSLYIITKNESPVRELHLSSFLYMYLSPHPLPFLCIWHLYGHTLIHWKWLNFSIPWWLEPVSQSSHCRQDAYFTPHLLSILLWRAQRPMGWSHIHFLQCARAVIIVFICLPMKLVSMNLTRAYAFHSSEHLQCGHLTNAFFWIERMLSHQLKTSPCTMHTASIPPWETTVLRSRKNGTPCHLIAYAHIGCSVSPYNNTSIVAFGKRVY